MTFVLVALAGVICGAVIGTGWFAYEARRARAFDALMRLAPPSETCQPVDGYVFVETGNSIQCMLCGKQFPEVIVAGLQGRGRGLNANLHWHRFWCNSHTRPRAAALLEQRRTNAPVRMSTFSVLMKALYGAEDES